MNFVTTFAEDNIAHILRSEVMPLCLIDMPVIQESSIYIIDDKINPDSACQKWRHYLFSSIFAEVAYINSNQIHRIKNPAILETRNGYIFKEFIDIPPSQQLIRFTDFLKEKTGTHKPEEEYVLLVQRPPGRRSLTEASSGLPLEDYLTDALSQRGIPFKHCDFGAVTPHEQVQVCRGATVLVGAHGAGLSNIIFTPMHCSVLEVNFRKYWNCDPVCDQHFSGALADHEKCEGVLTAHNSFHKADFRNLSLLLDRTYAELEVAGYEGYHARNPIGRNNMIVDGQKLIDDIDKHLILSKSRKDAGHKSVNSLAAVPFVGNPIDAAMSRRKLRQMRFRNFKNYLKSKIPRKRRA